MSKRLACGNFGPGLDQKVPKCASDCSMQGSESGVNLAMPRCSGTGSSLVFPGTPGEHYFLGCHL